MPRLSGAPVRWPQLLQAYDDGGGQAIAQLNKRGPATEHCCSGVDGGDPASDGGDQLRRDLLGRQRGVLNVGGLDSLAADVGSAPQPGSLTMPPSLGSWALGLILGRHAGAKLR